LNEVPPDHDEADEVDDLYRRASAADSSRPSESVRRAVLDHAAQLAAQRLREAGPGKIDFTRPAANQNWRRPAIFGTLAAAVLAGFMIGPQFFSPGPPAKSALPPARDRSSQSAAAPTAQVPTAPLQESAGAPQAPPSAPPPQSNSQVAEMKADKRPLRSTRGVAASPPVIPDDSQSADGQNLANVTATTQVQSYAKAQSADKTQSAANAQSAARQPSTDNAPASAAESAGAKTETLRGQSMSSSVGALSAGRAQTAAPAWPAPRPADLSVELWHAAQIGDLPALQALLGKQPAIDARDNGGRTALMLATLHGQSGAVEVLLASGADPNAVDAQGVTPLQAAMAANQPAIAEALRRAGAR
jgi:ankyrin repeat protein